MAPAGHLLPAPSKLEQPPAWNGHPYPTLEVATSALLSSPRAACAAPSAFPSDLFGLQRMLDAARRDTGHSAALSAPRHRRASRAGLRAQQTVGTLLRVPTVWSLPVPRQVVGCANYGQLMLL